MEEGSEGSMDLGAGTTWVGGLDERHVAEAAGKVRLGARACCSGHTGGALGVVPRVRPPGSQLAAAGVARLLVGGTHARPGALRTAGV